MTILNEILVFILGLVFNLITWVLLLRIILQMFHASIKNPICQLIAQVTNPIVLPLRKILPRVPYIDIATLLILLVVEFIKYIVLGFFMHHVLSPLNLIPRVIGGTLIEVIDIFFYAIIIAVLISWISPHLRNAFTEILTIITEPVLRLFRKIIPIIAGIDFSPLVALICLEIIAIIILSSLPTI